MMLVTPGLCPLSPDHMHSREFVQGERCAYCGAYHDDAVVAIEDES